MLQTNREKELIDCIEDLVYQFAYTGNNEKGAFFYTGGLSALEFAFEKLGWKEPHYVPEIECQIIGCTRPYTSGFPYSGNKSVVKDEHKEKNYLNTCSKHFVEFYEKKNK